MWFKTVLSILSVIERVIPIVERIFPKGNGTTKAQIVEGSAHAVAATLLPGVNLGDPTIAALVQAKIAADVALANALQAAAQVTTSTQPTLPLDPTAQP